MELWEFFNSRTRTHVNRVTEPAGGRRTQLGGLSFALEALFLSPDSPTQLQTVQFPYLNTWKVFKECREGGVGGYSPGQCTVYCMTQLLLLVQKPISLTLQ